LRVAAPTNRSESRRRASVVRHAGRFRGLSKGEASGVVGSGRDGAGCGACLGGIALQPFLRGGRFRRWSRS
jgi:hypothetical protein